MPKGLGSNSGDDKWHKAQTQKDKEAQFSVELKKYNDQYGLQNAKSIQQSPKISSLSKFDDQNKQQFQSMLNYKNLQKIPDLSKHKIIEEDDDDFSIYDHYDSSLSHGLAYQ